jgi:hypothetical protein
MARYKNKNMHVSIKKRGCGNIIRMGKYLKDLQYN